MQVVKAGQYKYILLELEPLLVMNLAKQAGFDCHVDDHPRVLGLELTAQGGKTPLLLFDAADPSNLGWFSRCQFYVDGQTGAVLQTPFSVANRADHTGKIIRDSVRIQVSKELPATFRLPGQQSVNEQMIYALLFNFLNALVNTGVGVCGGPIIRPLAGRTEVPGSRN